MKKKTKVAIITCSVLVLVVAIIITLLFTLINTYKFMAMSSLAIERSVERYSSRMQSDDPIRFIAHRGLSKDAYQNTEQAFLLAGQDEHVWGIETDVWMTSDGGMVCMHDANALKGVSNVRNITLEQATTTPLRNNNNEYAPSIDTLLSICATYDKYAIIELKDSKMTTDDMDRLLEIVHGSGAKAKIISFHLDLLEYLRSQDSEVGLQALVLSGNLVPVKTAERIIAMRCDLSSNYEFLTMPIINKFHRAGLKVGVWTINSAKDAVCCAGELKIDYITTDIRMYQEINEKYNLNLL